MIKSTKAQNLLQKNYDMIILGGGSVGLSFLNSIANQPYFKRSKILLLDKLDITNRNYSQPSPRVFFLNKNSIDFLELPYTQKRSNMLNYLNGMQIWSQDSPSYLQFQNSEDQKFYGCICDQNLLQEHLLSKVKDLDNVDFIYDHDIKHIINKSNQGVTLNLKNNNNEFKEVQTQLLVSAEGNNSSIAKILRINTKGISHKQKGLVTKLKVSNNHNIAYQKYFTQEVLGILPLSMQTCSIVWSVPYDYYDHLLLLNEEQFLNELNEKLIQGNPKKNDFINPPIFDQLLDKRLGFPLYTKNLDKYCEGNVVFIGDSAHSIHPMLGQGLNLGINDAQILSRLITKNFNEGKCLNNIEYLQDYQNESQKNNMKMQSFVQFLKFSFFTNNSILNYLRDEVIQQINNNNFIKNLIMRNANQLIE